MLPCSEFQISQMLGHSYEISLVLAGTLFSLMQLQITSEASDREETKPEERRENREPKVVTFSGILARCLAKIVDFCVSIGFASSSGCSLRSPQPQSKNHRYWGREAASIRVCYHPLNPKYHRCWGRVINFYRSLLGHFSRS